MRIGSWVITVGVAAVALAGCADAPEAAPATTDSPPPQAIVVVAKVAPLADLATQVVGDRGQAVTLVPAGLDAHTYEPTPGDVRRLASADLFVANGLHLNDALIRLAEINLPAGRPVVRLADLTLAEGDIVFDDPRGHTHGGEAHVHSDTESEDLLPNPHVWMNVQYARDYTRHIAAALAEIDPAAADVYRANAKAYELLLDDLHETIGAAVATIPDGQRKLVTYHDSWAYFAPAYGLELVAAVQPADLAEPSPAEVRRIIDEIRAQRVPAVFGSAAFPSDVLAAISRETGAAFVGDLSDDVLPGEPGTPEHSYVGMMLYNARVIVESLGGDISVLAAVAHSAGVDLDRLRQ